MNEQQRHYIGGDNEMMRISLIASLIVLLMAIPASHSQSDYPPCTAKQLQTVLSTVPAYDALRSAANDINSLEDFLNYAEEQLRFRETAWTMAPRCAESIDFFWQSTREAGFISAYWAMHYGIRESARGNPDFMEDLNPFIDPLADAFYPVRHSQLVMDLRDLVSDGNREAASSPEEVSLPVCSESQLASLAPLLPEYQQIIADSKEIASLDDLLDGAHALLGWRKNWTHESALDLKKQHVTFVSISREELPELPPCREAVELLWLMYRTVNDIVTGAALISAGSTRESHPYYDLFSRNANRIDELAILIESSEKDPSAPVEDWPSCTVFQQLDLDDSIPEYRALVEQIEWSNSLEGVIELADAEIAWRQSLWSHSPVCAQDIEEILILSQASSSLVATVAIHFLGVPIESNPFMEEMTLNGIVLDSFTSRGLGGDVLDDLLDAGLDCFPDESDDFSTHLAQYHILLERMWSFGGMEGLLPLLDLMIDWRDNLLTNMPTCDLSFDVSLLMSQTIDDYAAMIGLVYAKITGDSNPFLESFGKNSTSLDKQIEAILIPNSARAPLWRFGGQLPACTKDETQSLSAILSEYQALIESAGRIHDLEGLLDFGAAQVDWRDGSWQNLPACAEALGARLARASQCRQLFFAIRISSSARFS